MKYLGRYLSKVIGKSLTFVASLLPVCVRDNSIAWWRDFNYIRTTVGEETVSGLLAFDGVDDYISFSSIHNVTGNKEISFKVYFTNFVNENTFIFIRDGGNDMLRCTIVIEETIPYLYVWCLSNSAGANAARVTNVSNLENTELNIIINKSTSQVNSVIINGADNSVSSSGGTSTSETAAYIGRYFTSYTGSFYIWDVNINDEHIYLGQPNGNQNSAWSDTIGSINGTVNGSPTTSDIIVSTDVNYIEESIGTRADTVYYGQYLDNTSGQINLYRSSGTYDYTDPSDGSRSEGNIIPANGLITVPANGICDIGINRDGSFDGTNYSIYESFYPICERAGTVLHDINANSHHASVATPSWSEELYGSDYLNQCGFMDKTESDSLGYNWETNVNGSSVTLDDDCLVPISKWDYQNLIDVNEELVLDLNGEQIQVKVNN